MAPISRPEGGPFGLLMMAVAGIVALCCAVIVATGKPAPDEPAQPDDDEPRRAEAARAPEVEPVAAAPAPAPAVEPPPAPTAPEPAPEPAPPDPYAANAVGYLRIASTPPARIFVDGADTGLRTPIRGDKLPLAAGRHKVTFLVGDSKYTFSVRIKAGETLNLTKTFEEPPP
jgi:hypothetical protein